MPSRRAVLTGTSVALTMTSTGCLGRLTELTRTPPTLGWVAVHNSSERGHRFQIQIRREGSIVHDATHKLPGRSEDLIPGAVLTCTWGDTPGPYTIRARADDGPWINRSIRAAIQADPQLDDPACVTTNIEYKFGNAESFVFRVQADCDAVPSYDGGCPFANESRQSDSSSS